MTRPKNTNNSSKRPVNSLQVQCKYAGKYALLDAADDSGDQCDLSAEEHKRKQQTNEHTAGTVANYYSIILLAIAIPCCCMQLMIPVTKVI